MHGPDGLEERTAAADESARDREFAALIDDEPADDYAERAAERADYAREGQNQELRDAGRGHLCR